MFYGIYTTGALVDVLPSPCRTLRDGYFRSSPIFLRTLAVFGVASLMPNSLKHSEKDFTSFMSSGIIL